MLIALVLAAMVGIACALCTWVAFPRGYPGWMARRYYASSVPVSVSTGARAVI